MESHTGQIMVNSTKKSRYSQAKTERLFTGFGGKYVN